MRFSTPDLGTPESSVAPSASLPKSTSAWKELRSPVRRACACAWSRHQAGVAAVAAGLPISGIGSAKRKATLKNAGGPGTPPPGRLAEREEPVGTRYAPAALSHSPTPAASRTTERPGFQADVGTRTS